MSTKTLSALVCVIVTPAALAASCNDLAKLSLPATSVTKAETVAAGAFTLPHQPGPQPGNFKRLPAFCRVAAEIKPTSDSDIKMEVWLPLENWNGKFMGVGNGGWSGAIVYPALAMALGHGYAAASTDTGHNGKDATFALGHPEKLIDFAYRAVHEMTVKGKAIMQAFYSKGPQRSYWNGCSSGGKQGLKEAQKFPLDYDGIVAGAPANYWTHLMAGDLWPAVVTHKDPSAAFSQSNLAVLHKAVLQACDNLDGVRDGLIEDPTRCHFDPASLLCKGDETEGCLNKSQVDAARKIYAGATNPRTGESVFPGMTPGSELNWPALAGPVPFGIPLSHFQYVVFQNPKWDYMTMNFDKDVALADKIDDGLLNATNPDMRAFFTHGGKLLMYHGWNDELISPLNSVNFYKSVVKEMGGTAEVSGSYRLFMAPGMNHCGGGVGPSRIDVFTTIDDWATTGKAPARMLAEHFNGTKVDRSRPLCPYPQVAKYKG